MNLASGVDVGKDKVKVSLVRNSRRSNESSNKTEQYLKSNITFPNNEINKGNKKDISEINDPKNLLRFSKISKSTDSLSKRSPSQSSSHRQSISNLHNNNGSQFGFEMPNSIRRNSSSSSRTWGHRSSRAISIQNIDLEDKSTHSLSNRSPSQSSSHRQSSSNLHNRNDSQFGFEMPNSIRRNSSNSSRSRGHRSSRSIIFKDIDLEDKCGDSCEEPLSINYLSRLCKLSNDRLVYQLRDNNKGFINFFNSPIKHNYVTIIIELSKKICSINSELSKQELLNIILNSMEFIQSISYFVENIIEISRTDAVISRNIGMTVSFIEDIIHHIPNGRIKNFKLLLMKIKDIIQCLVDIPYNLIENLDSVINIINAKLDLIDDDLITYKSLSVFPTKQELNEVVIVDENIVKGAYNNTTHYIDVQFKLLKEDFVAGLRSGIKQYKKDMIENKVTRNHDIYYYRNVTYVGFSEDHNPTKQLLQTFELNKNSINKINWDVSQRLIHGVLLLFTNDNFDNFFLTILHDKKGGTIMVSLLDKNIRLKSNDKFLMIEPRVFYEPYFQVLKTLRDIHPQLLPFQKYIVQTNVNPERPKYLNKNSTYIINDTEVLLDNLICWPSAEALGINQSQRIALHAALTREFTIIQGPPGTGKTFLCLQIINILLDNKDKWSDGKTPIFLVCYKNHAVDQILDSLQEHNVVRLGGRSENENLKKRSLKSVIGHMRDPIMGNSINMLKDEMRSIKNQVCEIEKVRLFVLERRGVLSIDAMKTVLSDNQLRILSCESAYTNWLLHGPDYGPMYIIDWDRCEDLRTIINDSYKFISISLNKLEKELRMIDFEIQTLQHEHKCKKHNNLCSQQEEENFLETLSFHYMNYNETFVNLQKVANRLNMKSSETSVELLENSDLSLLSTKDRWTLYKHWANKYILKCEENLIKLIENYNIKLLELLDKRDINDGEHLRSARVDVIGATTTGAARLNKFLQIVKPKIVIIEEAAELLESHAIASLTEHCDHLILVGDHKQLRPNPANFTSVTDYKMDISLFERMIINEMECFTLSEQHRMRPEISSLVVPSIYKELTNNTCVEEYPNVKGLKQNLYFIDHKVSEDVMENDDSHRNIHEAHFIIALADYLIKQGYKGTSITILTMYSAQLFYLKKEKEKYKNLKDVHIFVVDNFQGEENDIILLSLVRSNSRSIGFLSKENRVCVALTRAKIGFYIIGNMNTLHDNSSVWKKMNDTLKNKNAIGDLLPLKCNTHKRITVVSTSIDFEQLENGGCTQECGVELDCSHVCKQMCHGDDLDHIKKFSCKYICGRIRNCGIHKCEAECGQECPKCSVKLPAELKCGHQGFRVCAGDVLPCKSKCSTILICGHVCPKDCHFDIDIKCEVLDHSKVQCTSVCEKQNKSCPFDHSCLKMCVENCGMCIWDIIAKMKCGHLYKGVCNEMNKTPCKVIIDKNLQCGHTVQAHCSEPLEKIDCTEKVSVTLPCGHDVETLCSKKDGDISCNTLEVKTLKCSHKVKAKCSLPADSIVCLKKIPVKLKCGHSREVKCSQSNSNVMCLEKCNIILDCGHQCTGNCGEPCPDCMTKVEINGSCGHEQKVSCKKSKDKPKGAELLQPDDCTVICNQSLPCNHFCKGSCGKCMRGRIHVTCEAECLKYLLCGHKCRNECWTDFHSCKDKCINVCKHQDCSRKCGEVCTKCLEPCEWSCSHFKCTKQCWEDCNRPQCDAPCKLFLVCGHQCSGYCGEPCPSICLLCSTNNKYNLQDRLILLEDCKHVISRKELSMMTEKFEGILKCPECHKSIVKTGYLRLQNKEFFRKYSKLKTKALEMNNNRTSIVSDICFNFGKMRRILKNFHKGCPSLNNLLKYLFDQGDAILRRKETKGATSILKLKALLFICLYIKEALEMTKVLTNKGNKRVVILDHINNLATYLWERKGRIGCTEMSLFIQELSRLRCIIDFIELKDDASFSQLGAKETVCYKNAYKTIFSFNEFTDENRLIAIQALSQIKEYLHNNNELISSKDKGIEKFNKFLSQYHPLYFHRDAWNRCKNGHIVYSLSHSYLCPVCTNNLSWPFLLFI